MSDLVLAGPRWRSCKWWDTETLNQRGDTIRREDLAERVSLSIESLRKAGFIARFSAPERDARYSGSLWRVEIYGDEAAMQKARAHLRGLWDALNPKGITPDYACGFQHGVTFIENSGKRLPEKLPLQKLKLLKG